MDSKVFLLNRTNGKYTAMKRAVGSCKVHSNTMQAAWYLCVLASDRIVVFHKISYGYI